MGLKLSRKIRSGRDYILRLIKKINEPVYKKLIFIGTTLRFIYKINRKKKFEVGSKNLDNINKQEYRITSQNNEDGIIDYIISKLKLKDLTFVEIGFDYCENNSLNLIKKSKKGLFIDGSKYKVLLLNKILKFLYSKKNIKAINAFINKDNLNNIISTNIKSREIDFLSIDVDGVDYYLLESLSLKPKIICIEYNFWYGKRAKCSVPYSIDFKWDVGSSYSGSSLSALNSLANSKDYHLIGIDSYCVNAFFIRGDFKSQFEILDPIKNFKYPNRYTQERIDREKKALLSKELTFFN